MYRRFSIISNYVVYFSYLSISNSKGYIFFLFRSGTERSIQNQVTAQKMKFSIKDSFIKCNQIYSFLRIWSHLLKKFLMENFIFCAVSQTSKMEISAKILNGNSPWDLSNGPHVIEKCFHGKKTWL